MRKAKRQPTLKNIAERVDVTVNTVSLALRDSPLVLPETKANILKVAREMGYVHNVLAGSLRSGKSHTIAILFGDVANLLFAQRIKALERVFRERKYQVLILNTEEDAQVEARAIRTAVSHQVDGIVFCPCQQGKESLELVKQYRVPCVLMGRETPDEEFDTVVWDDYEGARLATQHLIEAGSRSVVFLSGPEFISSARLRRKGYEDAMRAAGFDPVTVSADAMSGGVNRALDELSENGVRYDGLFVFSDLMALEASSWLMKRGIRVPEDVGVVGFDDILSSVSLPFELTSIASDRRAESEIVVDILLHRIAEPDAPVRIDRRPVRLVKRASSRHGGE
jgi:LacI family transcriptional regulator